MKKKNFNYLVIALFAVLFLASCAQGVDVSACVDGSEKIYGFWGGVWHGMIAPFNWFAGIFNENIHVYPPNNNGAWYEFGFVLGIGGFATGSRYTKQ